MNAGINTIRKMGDLEFGFEEMQGVKLGYLVIKGKQMFALSQVFTDLLKNIPRTTVHKRMDHLKVKKHHCDLEELRKLKAINSIAFHAAKCTLISREDVEALYFSCKTERVLKSNKRTIKTKAAEHPCEEKNHSEARNGLWKEKVWLSLRGVPQTLALQNKAVRREATCSTGSNLPQIYSKPYRRDFPTARESACKPFKNYETVQIPGNCVGFHQKHSFFRGVVNRQPGFYQSAIAAQPDGELLYKRKRKREVWSRNARCHQLLLVPKCCKPKVQNGCLSRFHLEQELYVDSSRHVGHFQENCSSDTESSTVSERINNDSDFGSSLSTTTNSGTSDDEEDDSLSCSSDDSSDEESSSQSDSSSVSSQVSVQSIRFRRAGFSGLSAKTPLVLQPTFHYRPSAQPKPDVGNGNMAAVDYEKTRKFHNLDITAWKHRPRECDAPNGRKLCPVGNCFSGLRKDVTSETVGLQHLDFLNNPKTSETVSSKFQNTGFTSVANGTVFPQQRTPGHPHKCDQNLSPSCAQDKERAICKPQENTFSLVANSRKDAKIGNGLKLPSPLKTIKTEAEEASTTTNSNTENYTTGRTTPFPVSNVKIKVEESFDEYEYANHSPVFQCKSSNDLHGSISDDTVEKELCEDASKPAPASFNQESPSTLNTYCAEKGEYKNGARVRKSNRTTVWGKKTDVVDKTTIKVDRSPRISAKCASSEGSNEDWTGASASKRKRVSNNASSLKKTFKFMANFPSPPSLIIGSDGDLSPAYSLKSFRNKQLPHRSHPVWRWQLGGAVVPPPTTSQRFRKTSF